MLLRTQDDRALVDLVAAGYFFNVQRSGRPSQRPWSPTTRSVSDLVQALHRLVLKCCLLSHTAQMWMRHPRRRFVTF